MTRARGGFKLPSELNKEMRPAFPAGISGVVENHYNGEYALIKTVTVGDVDTSGLGSLNRSGIAELADEIEDLLSKPAGNS